MLQAVVEDLRAEEDELEVLLDGLAAPDWDSATPAAGWSVRHQVAHLGDGEELAALAVSDPKVFAAALVSLLEDLEATMAAMGSSAEAPPFVILARWNAARLATMDGLRHLSDTDRVPWVTGEMGAVTFATARLMETWAHGQDIIDGLERSRAPTARLRHIAHLGVATRAFSFTNRGLDPPGVPVRVELQSPDGDMWDWGPRAAPDVVTGTALDFCLLVTQRRHRLDTALVTRGEVAERWMGIAQCFAGPPGAGRFHRSA